MPRLLEFNNVVCAAQGNERLDLSFAVAAGENVCFFGVERSGLRPLTQVMLGLEEGYEGDVLFADRSIRGLDYLGKMRYKNRIGYLHGDYGLLSNLTVEQNISLRLEYYSDLPPMKIIEITRGLMEELGIQDVRAVRPVELTASQILRTAYARAVAHNPELLIIEHALVGQSPPDIRSFMDVLQARAADRERALVFVTYEPQKFVDFVDTFRMLHLGKMVFEGGRDEFFGSDNPYLVQYRTASLQGPMNIR